MKAGVTLEIKHLKLQMLLLYMQFITIAFEYPIIISIRNLPCNKEVPKEMVSINSANHRSISCNLMVKIYFFFHN